MLKSTLKTICPNFLLRFIKSKRAKYRKGHSAENQDLSVYWDADMAAILETWGEKNVWKEIQYLMVNCRGKVLDVACGTGKTMEIVSRFPIEVYGCDISDLLIEKATARGIDMQNLAICDATDMPYENNMFEHAYSIGSLEHFTEDGIINFLKECSRVTSKSSFHQIPVSRNGKNEGWIQTFQSYHNNSVDWWLEKYLAVYKQVYVIDSTWEDDISVGKWFVCINE